MDGFDQLTCSLEAATELSKDPSAFQLGICTEPGSDPDVRTIAHFGGNCSGNPVWC